jgi:hypothetical protein
VWAGSSAFDVDGQRIVVRSTDRRVHELLRAGLRAHIADDGAEPCCTYSISVSDEDGHVLYRGSSVVIRTRQLSQLVATLLDHLSAHATPATSDYLHLYALAFLSDGAAVIVAWDFVCYVAILRSRIEGAGWRLLDGPVLIDKRTGELVVHDNRIEVDRDALDDVADASPGGRFPIVGWVFRSAEEPVSLAGANVRALRQVVNRSLVGAQAALDGVAAALAGAEVGELAPAPAAELAEPLLSLLRQFDGRVRA